MSGARPSPRVAVVLSAYNGAPHIAEQIASIRGQSFMDWNLIVRDDGSSDDTVAIVKELVAKDSRITLLEDSHAHLGPSLSFGALLEHVRAGGTQIVFLADQDDVWLSAKLEQQLALLDSAAPLRGAGKPVLVHSDLEVVDGTLHVIHESFNEFQRVSYNTGDPLRTLLIHNAVVGCTIGVNRELLDFALPIPAGSPHDWWLAVCAAATGDILRTAKPTVLYRQHATNVIGAVHRHEFVGELIRHPLSFAASSFRAFNVGVEQARCLRDRLRLKGLTDGDAFARVERYCDSFAGEKTLTGRLRALRESRARPQRGVSRIILNALAAVYPAVRSRLAL